MSLTKKLFPFLYKTDWTTKPDHEIKLAFVGSDGTEYFEFISGYSCYYERYNAILDRLAEIDCKVDKAYLDDFQAIMKEYLTKGDLYNASILLKNLEDRRNYIFNQELLYDLATVWYFDKSENCYAYNTEYAEIKKKRWKEEKGRLSFFFAESYRKIHALTSGLENEFRDLGKGGKSGNANSPKVSFVEYIRKKQRQRRDLQITITNQGFGGLDFDKIRKLTIFEWYEVIRSLNKTKSRPQGNKTPKSNNRG